MWFWIIACSIAPPTAKSPADDAREIPLDTQIAVRGYGTPTLQVAGAGPVPVERQPLDLDWVVLRPLEPLEPNIGYDVVASGVIVHFHTTDRFADAPGPVQLADVRAVAVRNRDDDSDCFTKYQRLELDFTASTNDVLFYEIGYTINGGPVRVTRAAPPFDGILGSLDLQTPSFEGGDWVCARMRSVGLSGDISPESDTLCAIVDDCERTNDGEQCGGCSASGSKSGAVSALLIALMAVGSSRRRRARARGRRRW